MNLATKRTIIGAAALAAAGLIGSLPYEGTSVAQQGVPTVHHDVALVDVVDAGEITYNNGIDTDVVAPNGFEDSLFISYGATDGPLFLDTAGKGAIFDPTNTPSLEYLNDFDGASTQLYDGYLADTVATEDEINGLLGVQAADQPALLANFEADYIGTAPTVALGSTFDSTLATIGTADDMAATSDFTAYGEYFLTNLTAFSTDGYFTTGLTDLTTDLDKLAVGLGTDFTTLFDVLATAF
jgi:hypothetical protein